MRKKILLPTDFSENSWDAMLYAIKFFEHHACDFYIINIFPKEVYGLQTIQLLHKSCCSNKISRKSSRRELGSMLMKLSFIKKDMDHFYHVSACAGEFIDEVKKAVARFNIDCTIMSAKGETSYQDRKFGKNTRSAMERVGNCPVLVVPENEVFKCPQEIVLAVNFDNKIDKNKVHRLAAIAKICNARILVLSVVENDDLNAKQKVNKALLDELLFDVQHSFNILHNKNMISSLSLFLDSYHYKMISFVNKKPTFWDSIGFGKPRLSQINYSKDVSVLAL